MPQVKSDARLDLGLLSLFFYVLCVVINVGAWLFPQPTA